MSALISETLSDAFVQLRLSYDRILIRLSRCAMSIMNLAVRLLQLFCVTLLYFSAVKSAYIPKENGGSTNEVVPFTEVYNKSMCRPREVLVEVHQEYPEDIDHIFIPSCVVLMRCAGCCNDEMLECTPTATRNITMEVQKLKPLRIKRNYPMSFAEHIECECRVKKEILDKTEQSPLCHRNSSEPMRHGLNMDMASGMKTLAVVSTHCKPCCSTCSERRRRLFIQDPETCQCTCKHSEADCKQRQLELNERTCKCDKPRR
ncbi:vascular endothelial growth factor Ab isoform 2-T2 [Clarias gariepinus]|uniref:vascular endothelial growth factor Ab isoform X2 n=1 Tax=Clarias gariepinus TaxID=13013 RepID=UPI00234D4A88|nr:vascular endothelial growth factor Ab isoform X2 [Clarias gariepinus]